MTREGREPLAVELGLPGEHNVRNALAAIAVATDFDVPDTAIQSALAGFGGCGDGKSKLVQNGADLAHLLGV